ncbi:DEAD/DEAH box helicase family protein [Variovorax sp. PBL-E5]|uniref:DEAD/DEAH box helicase family protein n=1 Tax=Variovorax sp. PBL-E5 TaxID=434014 RepID=UPI0013185888|nr:DEAD/DEAH box helicase family protein [Variovorax sp. PBL-E5]VTU38516.1 UvsW helicase [Variovorax sp. PBL-E5]
MTNEQLRSLKAIYKTRDGSIGASFFAPCLGLCTHYKRAAGFFSSTALVSWADALLANGTKSVAISLLISPTLSSGDKATFERATDPAARADILTRCGDSLVHELLNDPACGKTRGNYLLWLLATGKLEIRFALPQHVDEPGMYHQKSGVFVFPDGARVAFEGSANETASGYIRNYEKIHVFRSWIPEDVSRLVSVEADFDEQWNQQDEYLTVVPLSSESLRLIKERSADLDFDNPPPARVPAEDPKWRHQGDAARAFIAARRGVLEMATGTGKTKTALRIAKELFARGEIDSIIVCTEGTDLLQQWYEEILDWRASLERPLRVYRHFASDHQGMTFALNCASSALVVSRGQLGKFLPMLKDAQAARTLVIQDEVHGLGAPSNRTSLGGKHQRHRYVLGLSATPEREYDAEGTAFIDAEIGPTVFSFGLEDAIKRGILVEFDYVPLPYELTANDRERLKAVYARQSARAHSGQPMSNEELWTELSKVYKTAEQKPGIFADYLATHSGIVLGCILFVEEREYGERILPILHATGVRYRTYYADDDRENLVMFGRGEIDCVLTCHKISQGIDIKSLMAVVLFASAKARLETIQRVGRCLRSDPANPDKRATVVDFVLEAEEENPRRGPSADEQRRDWLTELSQVRREKNAN